MPDIGPDGFRIDGGDLEGQPRAAAAETFTEGLFRPVFQGARDLISVLNGTRGIEVFGQEDYREMAASLMDKIATITELGQNARVPDGEISNAFNAVSRLGKHLSRATHFSQSLQEASIRFTEARSDLESAEGARVGLSPAGEAVPGVAPAAGFLSVLKGEAGLQLEQLLPQFRSLAREIEQSNAKTRAALATSDLARVKDELFTVREEILSQAQVVISKTSRWFS